MRKTLRSNKGFTLVELAIVLVIIGIIIGGVLQGREMITNAKIKRVVAQEKEITAAIYSYQDRYNYLPGDDSGAAGKWAAATNGDGNGAIGGTAATSISCAAAAVEGCGLWDHLRRAGFVAGAPGSVTNPTNAFSGQIGVGNYAIGGTTANWVQFTNIPAEVAQIIDTQNDDGATGTGNIQGSAAYTAGTTVAVYFKLN